MQATLFRLTRTRALVALIAVAGMIGLAGCQTGPSVAKQEVGFTIKPSRTKVLAGENVTFTTYTQNLVGANASIHWTTSGGDLSVSKTGDVARVQFPDPGIYYVIADLSVNGTRVRSATAAIHVLPVSRTTLPGRQGDNQPNSNANRQNNNINNNNNNTAANQNNEQEQGQNQNQTMYK